MVVRFYVSPQVNLKRYIFDDKSLTVPIANYSHHIISKCDIQKIIYVLVG